MNNPKVTQALRDFEKELTFLINRYSLENMSNTPDYILARYLMQSLFNFNITSNDREMWFGNGLTIDGVIKLKE